MSRNKHTAMVAVTQTVRSFLNRDLVSVGRSSALAVRDLAIFAETFL